MKKILISISSFGKYSSEPIKLLGESGLAIMRNTSGKRLGPDELVSLGSGCVGIIAGLEMIDRRTMRSIKGLKVISRVGVGLDNVDLKAAEDLGIIVCNTPDAPTEAVAEFSVGLLLDLLRNISSMEREMRKGRWRRTAGGLLNGKTVGIIGFGRIGRRVAAILKGFGVSIIACDIKKNAKKFAGKSIKFTTMKKLLSRSDIIILHASGRERIIGKKEFGIMKKGARIINTARGALIDENALYHAVKKGRIAGAALDVFEKEPYEGPLTGLDNVILTPHAGSDTVETRIEMEMGAVKNLLKTLKSSGIIK